MSNFQICLMFTVSLSNIRQNECLFGLGTMASLSSWRWCTSFLVVLNPIACFVVRTSLKTCSSISCSPLCHSLPLPSMVQAVPELFNHTQHHSLALPQLGLLVSLTFPGVSQWSEGCWHGPRLCTSTHHYPAVQHSSLSELMTVFTHLLSVIPAHPRLSYYTVVICCFKLLKGGAAAWAVLLSQFLLLNIM